MRRLALALLTALALLLVTVQVPAQAYEKKYGRLWRGDGVLQDGCHRYRYHYSLHPHAYDWYIEIFISGPNGKTLGNNLFQKGDRPKRGTLRFKVCDNTTMPGQFKIRGQLHRSKKVCTTPATCESKEFDRAWIKPARFRLR
jgi:hypothetical protein